MTLSPHDLISSREIFMVAMLRSSLKILFVTTLESILPPPHHPKPSPPPPPPPLSTSLHLKTNQSSSSLLPPPLPPPRSLHPTMNRKPPPPSKSLSPSPPLFLTPFHQPFHPPIHRLHQSFRSSTNLLRLRVLMKQKMNLNKSPTARITTSTLCRH